MRFGYEYCTVDGMRCGLPRDVTELTVAVVSTMLTWPIAKCSATKLGAER